MRDSDVRNARSVREQVDEAEWQVREDLAAFYRLVALHGMTDLVLGHLSARVPCTTDQYLLNPYPRLFEQITASTLVKVDSDGNILLDVGFNYDIPAFLIHGAVYGARADAGSVAHTHTAAAMAWSALPGPPLPISPSAVRFHDALARHRFEGIFDNPAERARLVEHLADRDAALLENHGYLVCATDVAHCWSTLYELEQAALAHLAAVATGSTLRTVPPDRLAADRMLLGAEEDKLIGARWASQRARLDRVDPSYRC